MEYRGNKKLSVPLSALLNLKTRILTWLRYTLFIIVYPLGAEIELLCIYKAFLDIKSAHVYDSSMLNKLIYYFTILVVFSYIPGFPILYLLHCCSKRKNIGKTNRPKQAKINLPTVCLKNCTTVVIAMKYTFYICHLYIFLILGIG